MNSTCATILDTNDMGAVKPIHRFELAHLMSPKTISFVTSLYTVIPLPSESPSPRPTGYGACQIIGSGAPSKEHDLPDLPRPRHGGNSKQSSTRTEGEGEVLRS